MFFRLCELDVSYLDGLWAKLVGPDTAVFKPWACRQSFRLCELAVLCLDGMWAKLGRPVV